MQVDCVLFDLLDTLLLLQEGEAYHDPSLRKPHEFLVNNGISVSFEDFSHIYFEVWDEPFNKIKESLGDPHFSVRNSGALQRLG